MRFCRKKLTYGFFYNLRQSSSIFVGLHFSRLVPSLPPKKIVSDAHFLESRRRGLHRWLTLVCRHPVICQDSLVQYFLTDQGPEFQHRIKEIFRRIPDEFMTSDIAAIAKVWH